MNYGRMTRHHWIAKMHWWTWHPYNILDIQDIPHRCHHILFWNDLPIECIRAVTEYASTIVIPEVYEMMNWVLVKVEGILEAYNPECFEWDRLKEYLTRKNGSPPR